MKVKVISLPYIFHVLYVFCCTRPRYQVSVYRTIGPLVYQYRNFQSCPAKALYGSENIRKDIIYSKKCQWKYQGSIYRIDDHYLTVLCLFIERILDITIACISIFIIFICSFQDRVTKKRYKCKTAFQLRIKQSSYNIGPKTITRSSIDPYISDTVLEWSTKSKDSIMLTGLLVRMDEV